MSFFAVRFPDWISYGATGGPAWSTTVNTAQNGFTARQRNWLYPLHRYNVSHGIQGADDFEAVRAHFFNSYGAYDSFPYKDWADFRVSAAEGTGAILLRPDGQHQLARAYTAGTRTFVRPISLPVAGTVDLVGGGDLDYLTGIITGGDPTAWTGEFDVPVNFVSDSLSASIDNRFGSDELAQSWGSIELQEVRL